MTIAEMTRDISYAPAARSRGGRALIRALENATGRHALIRRASGYEAEIAKGRSFWQVIPELYGLSLDIVGGSLAKIPSEGPLVLIANHPFGILDGLMLGHLLDAARGDFRILANSVFNRAEALNRVLLPISFDETKEALRLNLETRATALATLANGGAIGVFPGGTVSTSAKPFFAPDGSGLAQLYRENDLEIRCHRAAGLLFRPQLAAVSDRFAYALHLAAGPAAERVPQPAGYPRQDGDRRSDIARQPCRPEIRPQRLDGNAAPRHLSAFTAATSLI